MKNKTTLLGLILVVIFTSCKQTPYSIGNDNIGYDKVKWGIDIKNVKKVYPNGTIFSDYYQQLNIEGKINRRDFYFYQNKLYKVVVDYERIEKELVKSLCNNLTLTYKNFEGYSDLLSDYNETKSVSQKFYHIYYHKNLTIRLRIRNTNHDDVYCIRIEYFDPTINELNIDI